MTVWGLHILLLLCCHDINMVNFLLIFDHVGCNHLYVLLLQELLALVGEEVSTKGRLHNGMLQDVSIMYRNSTGMGCTRINN